jgi:SpoVK/Ycf46/Vps4 family AAA+-type ATPase
MGKVFSGVVGSSEENIRSVIAVAESVSPCILWTDEIDKGFSGTASSNQTDGGTASRVFGSFLTWMQEKKKPVFVVATANDVSALPPELLRKGRFDEIFFVDLPTESDRQDIFKIHLSKRNRNVADFDVKRLAKISQSFTGAEIEAAIISAMYESFDDAARPVTTQDIEKALRETVPIAVTMREKIGQLRDWAETRARNANREQNAEENVEVTQMRQELMAGIEDQSAQDDVEQEYL